MCEASLVFESHIPTNVKGDDFWREKAPNLHIISDP